MLAELKLYYKNIINNSIDGKGVSAANLSEIAKIAEDAITNVNKDRNDGLFPYRDLPYVEDSLERVKTLASNICDKFEHFAVLGGGISVLGGFSIAEAINPKQAKIQVYCDAFKPIMPEVMQWSSDKLAATLFNIVDLGEDQETTLQLFKLINNLIGERLGKDKISEHIILSTTATSGEPVDLCKSAGIKIVSLQADIKPNEATFAEGGLLTAAVMGVDTEMLLAGARAIDLRCGNEDFFRNPAAMIAVAIKIACHKNLTATLAPTIAGLDLLCYWLCRLWQESISNELPLKSIAFDKIFDKQLKKENDMALIISENISASQKLEDYLGLNIILEQADSYGIGQLAYLMQTVASIVGKLSDKELSQRLVSVLDRSKQDNAEDRQLSDKYII